MSITKTSSPQPGIVVSTAITAGDGENLKIVTNHAEGIVLR